MNTLLRVAGIIVLLEGFNMTLAQFQGYFILAEVSKYSGMAGHLHAVFYGPALMFVGALLLYFSLPVRW